MNQIIISLLCIYSNFRRQKRSFLFCCITA